MATRSGKANTVQPMRGAASPRIVLFRNAGLASVWDWGNDIDLGGPVGTPVVRDIDCGIAVTAEASLLADSTLAVNGMCVVTADTGVVTTGAIAVLCDQRLAIYQVMAFEVNCDLRALTRNARSVLFDERVGVSNVLLSGFDVDAEITGLLEEQYDLSLRSCALRTVHGDILVAVPNPMLLAADTSVAICGEVSTRADQRIVVSGDMQLLADCLQSLWRTIERQMNVRLIVGERTCLEADQAWLVSNIRISDCDTRAGIMCLMALESDIRIRTTTRLVPDVDTHQRVFAVILCEDHIIEV